MPFILIALILIFPYVLSLRGRTGHTGIPELRCWAYAHRGLHGNNRPENGMAAFQAALDKGYGIELDIHLMADGNLAVIHDASLKRTAGADVNIEDLKAEDLQQYCLEGTQEKIPLFSQVLELFDGKAPLIVELKSEQDNYAALCETACNMLEKYHGAYCLESFDPRCVYWLRKNRPELIRGQLAQNYFSATNCKLPLIFKFVLTNNMLNFLTAPDFIAYRYADRKRLSNILCRKLWRVQGVTWTLKTPNSYTAATEEGWIPIFEDFKP